MITVTEIRNVNYAAYDETWAIVRSLKNPGKMRRVPELSPSWALFKKYLRLRDADKIMAGMEAQRKLSELIELDKQGKRICMACFCRDEALCHRSIIAGIVQSAGIQVQGVKGDYSEYGRYKEILC